MSEIQNKKTRDLEKPFPGCLGRMVNLFDLNTAAGNRLLTDQPHRNGSLLSSSQHDMASLSPVKDQMEDKVVVSELKRNSSGKKSNGTPMKMLIAQEMSKELVSKHNPPSVVAKLMGLDALPRQEPDLAAQRSYSNKYSQCYSGVTSSYWKQGRNYLGTLKQEVHEYSADNKCKDVYEIWQQSPKTNSVRDKSPRKGRYSESTNEKKMALVREKFVEAKRLATDEKLRQSKQFQDALEVLSSNKDLLVKFLQEPNSLLPQHMSGLPSTPTPLGTKRITVLKPSKMVDNNKFAASVKSEKQTMKPTQMDQVNGWEKGASVFSPPPELWRTNDHPAQPTRIVVLKPSPGKPHDIKAFVSPPSSSPTVLHNEKFYGHPGDEAHASREEARDFTQHMCDNLGGHRRDETLLSSVFSNGYIGDESSYNKSENEHVDENLSDLEIMSPTSRRSWDYVNGFGSPYSSSSFSHASYSPESSVCREAKKRLSERWAMMANNGGSQEHRHVRRSSSTLGEMLALSDTKKALRPEEVKGCNTEQAPRGSASCLHGDSSKDGGADDSPRNLLRSKSLPISSAMDSIRFNAEVSDAELVKADSPKDLTKSKGAKSSFKGKVSSLFFSRNKKPRKEKFGASQSNDETRSAEINAQSPGKTGDSAYLCGNDREFGGCAPTSLHGFVNSSSPEKVNGEPKQGIISQETGLSIMKPAVHGISSENQEHPSPISVLEPPFEEDDRMALEAFSDSKRDRHGAELPIHSLKSNLIDKSPPIGSIARTLSWEDSCVATATSYQVKQSLTSQGIEEEQHEWLFYVESLLSSAGLHGEMQSESILPRWYSPESPLDPSLRDKFVGVNDMEILHEAKKRQRRSTSKLVFDYVNAALMDTAGYGSVECQRSMPHSVVHSRFREGTSSSLVDLVWARIEDWFGGEVRCVAGDGGDSNSLVVETVVREEVVGKGWVEQLRLEMDSLGLEIESKLLVELVQEAVVDLTGIE